MLAILSRGDTRALWNKKLQESRSQRGFDLPSLCHKFIKFSCLDTRPRVEFPSSDKYLRAALKFCLQKCNQTNHVMMQVITRIYWLVVHVAKSEGWRGTTFKVVKSMSVYVLSNHPSPLVAFKYKSNEGKMCVVYHQICSTQLETTWIYSTDSMFCQYTVKLD